MDGRHKGGFKSKAEGLDGSVGDGGEVLER